MERQNVKKTYFNYGMKQKMPMVFVKNARIEQKHFYKLTLFMMYMLVIALNHKRQSSMNV